MNKCNNCESTEFITQPNSYEVYKLIDGELSLQKNELINDDMKLSCRNCGKEFSLKDFVN